MRGRRTVLRPLPGDVVIPVRAVLPLAERLWPKVAGPRYSTPERPIGVDDCWDWISPARAGVYRIRGDRRAVAGPDRLDYGRMSRGRCATAATAASAATPPTWWPERWRRTPPIAAGAGRASSGGRADDR